MDSFEGTDFEVFANAVGFALATVVKVRPQTREELDTALDLAADQAGALAGAEAGLIAEAVQMIRGGCNLVDL